jgi:hypothetical protein
MTVTTVLDAVFNLLVGAELRAVRRVYRPGRPAGPYAQNLPAVLITPGDPAEEREFTSSDTVSSICRVNVLVVTRELLESQEQPANIEEVVEITESIVEVLEADETLGGVVDAMRSLAVHLSPGQARIALEYVRIKDRIGR